MQRLMPYLFVLVSTLLLQGCAPLVVGGAATSGVLTAHDRRSAGSVVEDQGIELTIFHYKKTHPEIKSYSDISSTSYNRQVLLTGSAQSRAVADQVVNYVKGLSNVRQVFDEIEINDGGGFGDTVNDTYLNSQAKMSLFRITKIKDFDPTRVKVSTYNGSVYLMGLVTPTEGNAAAEEVRYVNGVKRVVKHFEYVDLPKPGSTPQERGGRGSVTTTPLQGSSRAQEASPRPMAGNVYGGGGADPSPHNVWQ
ncbi:MAG: BON domain-containing protein [Gammaproteobacteria bacterium]|nr:BON domain-containing protein [Gammaproteobacteria bacterium]MBU1653871.1 BON domain-containing protein [Gammaproteobacteria bacterium]MBU1962583.1 BON domain-containing protein [Gammaproteobacteria bacterium]